MTENSAEIRKLPKENVLNIHQRISAIQNEVTKVDKSANVDGKYDAVTHDDVTRMLRPLMVKHGVISIIDCSSNTIVDTGVFYGKRKAMQLQGRFVVTYFNIDDPKDLLTVIVDAHADDAGDKAPGKVLSYAQKYADLKTFRITTGEDDEKRLDESKITEPMLTTEHYAELWAKADEILGDKAEDTLASMATKVFQVPTVADILDKHFDVAMKKIESKKESS